MDRNQPTSMRKRHANATATLTSDDIALIVNLIGELKEFTLSRGTYLAASQVLQRLGCDIDTSALARTETQMA